MLKQLEGFIAVDISNEAYREYVYMIDGEQVTYFIAGPKTLYMKESDTDSHRVIDENGECHYISRGWLAIRWPEDALEF